MINPQIDNKYSHDCGDNHDKSSDDDEDDNQDDDDDDCLFVPLLSIFVCFHGNVFPELLHIIFMLIFNSDDEDDNDDDNYDDCAAYDDSDT